MLRYITIFFIAVSMMSCEKEPLECELVEVQRDVDTITIYSQVADSFIYDPVTNITTVTYMYLGWQDFEMPVYMLAWLATNPVSTDSGAWYDWASDSTNTNPDYSILSTEYYMGTGQGAYWNADYKYNNVNKSDLIANGDIVTEL